MPNLYPTFEPPTIVEQEQPQLAPEYPKSYLFDFEKWDFARDASGRIAIADGHTAWVQWCVKAVLTERLTYVIYSSGYGCEVEHARRQPSRQAIEAELERVITEALLADPRTEMVRDFRFSWEGDQLTVIFTAVPVIGNPEVMEVVLSG